MLQCHVLGFPAKHRGANCVNLALSRRPTSLEGLLAIKADHPGAKLVVGNTEVGIEMKFKHAQYPHLVGTTHVPELNRIEVGLPALARRLHTVPCLPPARPCLPAWYFLGVPSPSTLGACACPIFQCRKGRVHPRPSAAHAW